MELVLNKKHLSDLKPIKYSPQVLNNNLKAHGRYKMILCEMLSCDFEKLTLSFRSQHSIHFPAQFHAKSCRFAWLGGCLRGSRRSDGLKYLYQMNPVWTQLSRPEWKSLLRGPATGQHSAEKSKWNQQSLWTRQVALWPPFLLWLLNC